MKRVNKDRKDEKHFAFIHELPCLRCPSLMDIVVAHIIKFGNGGIGIKPTSDCTVPLCDACHRRQHTIGEVTFWGGEEKIWKAKEVAIALKEVTGDVRTGTQIVTQGRREIWA